MIIDVRQPWEFAEGHVKGAINLTPEQIADSPNQLKGIKSDRLIIVYCNSGRRSQRAQEILYKQGFTNVKNGINKNQAEQFS